MSRNRYSRRLKNRLIIFNNGHIQILNNVSNLMPCSMQNFFPTFPLFLMTVFNGIKNQSLRDIFQHIYAFAKVFCSHFTSSFSCSFGILNAFLCDLHSITINLSPFAAIISGEGRHNLPDRGVRKTINPFSANL